MKKIISLAESMIKTQNEVREGSIKYLRKVLKKNGGKIDFNDYDTTQFVSVTYDGGNHPEYASNAFSTVNSVFIDKNGDICLNTEDSSGYDIDNISWEEVFEVAQFMYEVLKIR